MAGDWIKMRGNLWDDPRVAKIVDMTDSSEAAVIGALYWLWATADQHTEDGAMPGLTLRSIDRKTGIKGFAEALCAIEWLEDHPEGVRIVDFEKHNGSSAKKRLETAKRVATHRSKESSEVDAVREWLPDSVRKEVFDRDGNACVYCSRPSGKLLPQETKIDGQMHIDHVIPLARGGTNDAKNLVCACRKCNTTKSDRTPDEAGMLWPIDASGERFGNAKVVTQSVQDGYTSVSSALAREREEKSINTPIPPSGADNDSTPEKQKPELAGFAMFWEMWPTNDRKQAKGKCLESWKKASAERDAALVLAHVSSLKNSAWLKDGGQFVPAPLVYLNQRRWEGAESSVGSVQNGILAGAI